MPADDTLAKIPVAHEDSSDSFQEMGAVCDHLVEHLDRDELHGAEATAGPQARPQTRDRPAIAGSLAVLSNIDELPIALWPLPAVETQPVPEGASVHSAFAELSGFPLDEPNDYRSASRRSARRRSPSTCWTSEQCSEHAPGKRMRQASTENGSACALSTERREVHGRELEAAESTREASGASMASGGEELDGPSNRSADSGPGDESERTREIAHRLSLPLSICVPEGSSASGIPPSWGIGAGTGADDDDCRDAH